MSVERRAGMKITTMPNVNNSATRSGILKNFHIVEDEKGNFDVGRGFLYVPRNYKEDGEYKHDIFQLVFPQEGACKYLKDGMHISILSETVSQDRGDGTLYHIEIVKTVDFRKN